MTQRIYLRNSQGELAPWHRTRIRGLAIQQLGDDQLKADESFLENVIAEKPDLLGIGDTYDESDIEGPFCALTQLPLRALNGRMIYPDLVLLWQSGHIVVVEVKLADNPELRDRQVVAQLLEYAASLAQCSEQTLLELFGGLAPSATSWANLIQKLFPQSADPERLARRLFEKFRSSKLHLIIACDEAPAGLRELVQGVVGQSALGDYEFRVVEVMPYVPDKKGDGIVFLPRSTLQTEVVARSAVTVTFPAGQPQPVVSVSVTPLDEVTERVRSPGVRKKWTEALFFDDAQQRVDAATLKALRWIYDTVPRDAIRLGTGGAIGSLMVDDPRLSDGAVYVFYSDGKLQVGLAGLREPIRLDFKRKLAALPDLSFADTGYPIIKADAWMPHKERLLEILREPSLPTERGDSARMS